MSALKKMLLDEAAGDGEEAARAKRAFDAYMEDKAPEEKPNGEPRPKKDEEEQSEDGGETEAEAEGETEGEDGGETEAEDKTDDKAAANGSAKADDGSEDAKRADESETDAKKAKAKAKALRAQSAAARDDALMLACNGKAKDAARKLSQCKSLDAQASRYELHARQQTVNAANARSIAGLKKQVATTAKATKVKAKAPKAPEALTPILPGRALGVRGEQQQNAFALTPEEIQGLKMIPRHNLEKAGIIPAASSVPLLQFADGRIGVGLVNSEQATEVQKLLASTYGKLVS